jgi:hypothetical protein
MEPSVANSEVKSDGKARKRFRLYFKNASSYCTFFRDVLRAYPATWDLLELWDIDKQPAEHEIGGVPCIFDLSFPKSSPWLGSRCFDWMRKAVVVSAQRIPLRMPPDSTLRDWYSSGESSSADPPESSVSPEIDANQEHSEHDASPNSSSPLPPEKPATPDKPTTLDKPAAEQ